MLDLLNPSAAAPPAQPSPHPEPHLPDTYDGDPSTFRSFLSPSMTFEPHPYSSKSSQVAFMITHLTASAREWDRQSVTCRPAKSSAEALPQVFRSPGKEAARGQLALRQRGSRVAGHAICFLTAESEWDENCLVVFLHSLTEDIKDRLAPLHLPSRSDSLVALAIKTDKQLHEKKMERT